MLKNIDSWNPACCFYHLRAMILVISLSVLIYGMGDSASTFLLELLWGLKCGQWSDTHRAVPGTSQASKKTSLLFSPVFISVSSQIAGSLRAVLSLLHLCSLHAYFLSSLPSTAKRAWVSDHHEYEQPPVSSWGGSLSRSKSQQTGKLSQGRSWSPGKSIVTWGQPGCHSNCPPSGSEGSF